MLVVPLSASLQTCFSVLCLRIYLQTSVILLRLIFLRNSSRPTTTATGCEILLHVVLYSARSRYISQEKWVGSEFACFVRLSIVFFECFFKPFLCLLDVKKPKKISGLHPLSPHQGSVMDPLGGLQHPPCLRRYRCQLFFLY